MTLLKPSFFLMADGCELVASTNLGLVQVVTIQYEFNRTDRTLTYAGSTTKDNVTTTIVGSGLCEDASTEKLK